MSEFYNQGAVPLTSDAYVSRLFEENVYQEIIAGRWVLLLGPRQHGKSTGLVRLRRRFEDARFIVCNVDLQGLSPVTTFPDLLRQVSNQIGRSLGIRTIDSPAHDMEGDFLSWLEVVLPRGATPVVITIDECASIEDSNFRNSFFGQIRQISSQRASAEDTDVPGRVRFIFSGTFRPETLVHEQNSPFNVCQPPIQTEDLTVDQARELADKVHKEIVPLVDDAFAIVGGQPFLLQTLFLEAMRSSDTEFEPLFRAALANLRVLAQGHLEGIFSKVIGTASLVEKVSAMVETGYTKLIPADSDCSFLQVIGLAKRDGPNLMFRNRLYADVAKESPQLRTTNVVASSAPVFGLERDSLGFMKNAALRQVASSAYDGGANAHHNGNYRLALVGFGSATEAVLMDFLDGLPPPDLASAVTSARAEADIKKRPNFDARFEIQTDPKTWRLVNLIKVSCKVNVGTKAPEPSDALREWRNLVHPAEAIKYYPDESKLKPESVAAAALFIIFARDIKEIV